MIRNTNFDAPAEQINRWRTLALGIGGILSIVILIVALLFPEQREQALRSWLLGFIFWGGIGIGGLGVLILQYLTGGAWGIVIRRVAEAASRTLPIIFVLFLPVMFGITYIYEWTHLPNDPIVQLKQPYLSVQWWIIRAVLYFILWGVMAYLLNRWSAAQDQTNDADTALKLTNDASKFSGPTMVFYVLVVSFAAIDWVMTLDPHWYSTIWGLLFAAGWALSFFCFAVAILAALSDKAPMNRILGSRHFHDIGKLMLALVMVWAYFNFSQFLIIWSGNLPEETKWYLTRWEGTWKVIGILLIFFHFAFPFLVLLNRDLKRKAKWLAIMAIFILVLRLVDMYYLIGPSPRIGMNGQEVDFINSFSWMDIVAPFAVGGIWLWWFFGELLKRPLVPINDPYLEGAIEHGKGH
ncbi:MAG: hypothetical protein H0X15_09670 [Acidobacteria bacterium]|jgi:hypothetical protein|nr:hypothetical protein [Acidobacteriota bacterium]MBA3785785.1 hypothetical protein [Acidobacteriota bacterium]MBA4123654.1 hypothetical protein [Acidobacteriota bacterium]